MKHLLVAQILSHLEALQSLVDLAAAGGAEDSEGFLENLNSLIAYSKDAELEFSVMEMIPLRDVVSTGHVRYKYYTETLKVLRGRIIHELSVPRFFCIPTEKAKFYEQKNDSDQKIEPFGVEVQTRYGRRAERDIDEAGKAYALGRNTACVFHLMRVIEVGLDDTQRKLKVKSKSPNWDIILRDLQVAIDSRVGKNPKWRKPHRFYSDVISHLRNIKDAWRNPVMHVIEWHDEESAGSIYSHTKAFMQRLAKGP